MNFDKLIYELNDIDEILIDEIKNRLHDYNFCIIRGLLDPKLIKIAIDSKLSDYVKNNTDSSTTGENPSEIRNIFMKIIVTGAAGFIGFHLIKKLIQKRNIQVLGIDSVNNYYSTKVKKFRIKKLNKISNY